jgi:hypothetical protein
MMNLPSATSPVSRISSPQLEGRNRLTAAFRLILAIPHFIVLALLGVALLVVGVIAFVAVSCTGRWPDGLRDFALGVGRWWLRFEAYLVLLTDGVSTIHAVLSRAPTSPA